MSTNAPGVQATINTAPFGQPAPAQSSDMLFIIGWAIWGPKNTPTLVTSWNDYVSKFGGLHASSDMATAIYLFFKNGGRRAYVTRVMDAAAAKATVVIPDGHTTPVTILTATAKYASEADAIAVKITISAGTASATKKLVVENTVLGVREVYDNFKITFTTNEQNALNAGNSPFYDFNRVNAESKLITLAKNGSNAHTSPDNLPAANTYNLTGGDDDIADITDFATALALLDETFGPGQLAAPGFVSQNAALVAQAEATKRIALLDLAADDNLSDALTARAVLDSSYAALYYPARVQMRDINGSGAIKEYSPVGAIAGIFAKSEQEIGIHKAPANYRLTEVVGLNEATFGVVNDSMRESLNEKQINAIASLPEQGIKVYGARVLKSYGRITAIHEQRILNAAYYRLKRSLQEFVFQPANQGLFREIRSVCSQYMRELYRSGALYSPTGSEDDAYRVICDETNNPPEQLQQHKVSVDVWMHLVGMAEVVLVRLNSVPLATEFDSLVGGNQ